MRLLDYWLYLHHSSSVQHCRINVFVSWVTQTRNQNVFGELVCVEADSRQRKTISKFLCDHRFRPREVCRKNRLLIFHCNKFLFLTIYILLHAWKKKIEWYCYHHCSLVAVCSLIEAKKECGD